MIGLDAAGYAKELFLFFFLFSNKNDSGSKSTILYKLKLGEVSDASDRGPGQPQSARQRLQSRLFFAFFAFSSFSPCVRRIRLHARPTLQGLATHIGGD